MIVNPTNSEMNVTLNTVLSSIKNEKTMTIFMNDEKLHDYSIPTELVDTQIRNLVLKPGINVVTFEADKSDIVPYHFMDLSKEDVDVGFKVKSISITN